MPSYASMSSSSVRFLSLWAVNGPLDAERLRAQLDQFKALGLEGVVFHPRFYPNVPPYLGGAYLQIVSETILYAKSIGLAFWIYDEDGWPSGTVGGQLLKEHSEVAQHWAGLVAERPTDCLAEFKHEGKRWFLADRKGEGVDYLNRDLARHFLSMTHEKYRAGLTSEAFAHVEAFFCDEPELGLGHAYDNLPPDGAIPWTPTLPRLYRERFGEDLMVLLPKLFFPLPGYREARIRFWEFVGSVFCEAFLQPLNEWCQANGKLFTAHIKGEEHPLFQVPLVGSCSAVFRHIGLPGIDALERFPGNSFYPRQLASSAQQFGSGRCMVEAFGGAGWGATPEDLERYLLWLGGHGITDFVMHLSQYQLDSAAIRDWPPSQPLHLNWIEAYPEVLRHVREKLEKTSKRPADTLVISPHRGVAAAYEPKELLQTNIHNAATYPDTEAGRINRRFLEQIEVLQKSGLAWHVTDAATFEAHARRDGEMVRLGHCVYRRVVKADGAQLSADWTGLALLSEATARPVEKTPTKASHLLEAIQPVWSWLTPPENVLLLEPDNGRDGWFSCLFFCQSALPAGETVEVRFADEVSKVWFNGREVDVRQRENGSRAMIGGVVANANQVLSFLRPQGRTKVCAKPCVWLHGRFRVLSRQPFVAAPGNATVKTAGPFMLAAQTHETPMDFVAAGYPFMRSPVSLATTFSLVKQAHRLKLGSLSADAARVMVDGVELGWVWGPEWEIEGELAPGVHALSITLIPSTYNYFGPHHYQHGDWHVVSPDQFSGRRNFADPAGSLANTLVADWHFVPFRAPGVIQVLGKW